MAALGRRIGKINERIAPRARPHGDRRKRAARGSAAECRFVRDLPVLQPRSAFRRRERGVNGHVRPFQVEHHQAQEGAEGREAREGLHEAHPEITVAARQGGGGDRLQSQAPHRDPRRKGARACRTTTIDRAIKKGHRRSSRAASTRRSPTRATGRAASRCCVEVLTDNRNRTVGRRAHRLRAARRQPRRVGLRRVDVRTRRAVSSVERRRAAAGSGEDRA